MTNSWTNADGEPIMDGNSWRFEQQLDIEYAEQRADWDEDYLTGDTDNASCEDVDKDDDDGHGRFWCYGCDGYADHTIIDPTPVEQWEVTEPRDVYWSGTGEDIGDDSYIAYLNH